MELVKNLPVDASKSDSASATKNLAVVNYNYKFLNV